MYGNIGHVVKKYIDIEKCETTSCTEGKVSKTNLKVAKEKLEKVAKLEEVIKNHRLVEVRGNRRRKRRLKSTKRRWRGQ